MNQYRHNLNGDNNDTILSRHYHENEYEGLKHDSIQIIDYLKLDNATLDMLDIVPLYPFGLNDQYWPMSTNVVTQTDLTKLHSNNTFYFCYPTK